MQNSFHYHRVALLHVSNYSMLTFPGFLWATLLTVHLEPSVVENEKNKNKNKKMRYLFPLSVNLQCQNANYQFNKVTPDCRNLCLSDVQSRLDGAQDSQFYLKRNYKFTTHDRVNILRLFIFNFVWDPSIRKKGRKSKDRSKKL